MEIRLLRAWESEGEMSGKAKKMTLERGPLLVMRSRCRGRGT